ncbi:DUF2255 family protein [Streptomyces sp. NBC_01506]|uniref:DUF2255 family protein n=1 Tax=Streptomyces sp. NBC_01506 TaxID=2903887 RepID=UPI00386FA636
MTPVVAGRGREERNLSHPTEGPRDTGSGVRPWTAGELRGIDAAYTIVLTADVGDGRPPRPGVEIGVVVVDGEVFVCAYQGPVSHLFRATQELHRGVIRVDGADRPVAFDVPVPQDARLTRAIDDA